jgi:hypothetical protein
VFQVICFGNESKLSAYRLDRILLAKEERVRGGSTQFEASHQPGVFEESFFGVYRIPRQVTKVHERLSGTERNVMDRKYTPFFLIHACLSLIHETYQYQH